MKSQHAPADENKDNRRISPRQPKPKVRPDFFLTESIQFSESDDGKEFAEEQRPLQRRKVECSDDSDYKSSCDEYESESDSDSQESHSSKKTVWYPYRFQLEGEIVADSDNPELQKLFRKKENYCSPQKVDNLDSDSVDTPLTNTGRRRKVRKVCDIEISFENEEEIPSEKVRFFQISPSTSPQKSKNGFFKSQSKRKNTTIRRELFPDPKNQQKEVRNQVISLDRLEDACQKRVSTRSFTGNRSAAEILKESGFNAERFYELSHIFAEHQGCFDIIHQYSNEGSLNGIDFIVAAPKAENSIRLAMERAATQIIEKTGKALVYDNITQLKLNPNTGKPTHVLDVGTNYWHYADKTLKIEIRADDAKRLNLRGPALTLNSFMDILFEYLVNPEMENDDQQVDEQQKSYSL